MIQMIIKKVLRKWLKKKVYNDFLSISTNVARFEWVYNSPLHQWRDRIWVVTNCARNTIGAVNLDDYMKHINEK